MKMKEKTKLKTIEEIPLEELKSQVPVECQLSNDFNHLKCGKFYANYQIIC